MRLPSTLTEPLLSALCGLTSAASGLSLSAAALSLSAAKAPGASSNAAIAATRGSLRMGRSRGTDGSAQHRQSPVPVHTPEVTPPAAPDRWTGKLAAGQQGDRQHRQRQASQVEARQPLAE